LPTLTTLIILFSLLDILSGPGPPPGRGFEITLRHTILETTPLEEWSNSRRDINVTTHNVYNRDIMLQTGFEPAIPASENPQTHTLGRAATTIGAWWYSPTNICGLEQITKFLIIKFPAPLCYFPLASDIPFNTLLKYDLPVFTLLTCHKPTTSPTCA
jgi:hypothetical protein